MGSCQPASVCDRLEPLTPNPTRPRPPREIILLPSKLSLLAREAITDSPSSEILPCPYQPDLEKAADKPTQVSIEENVRTEQSNRGSTSEHTPLRVNVPSQINESLMSRWDSPNFDPHELFVSINYDGLFREATI